MSKATNWFKHDFNARNDEKLLLLSYDFGFEIKGLFWDIVEKMYESGDGSFNFTDLKLMAKLNQTSFEKVELMFLTIVETGLFFEENDKYFSLNVLQQIETKTKHKSEVAEKRRLSGSKGGVAKSSKVKQSVAKSSKTLQNDVDKIRLDKTRLEENKEEEKKEISKDISKESFDKFRIEYRNLLGGVVLGLDTEFKNFQRVPNWQEVLPKLINAVYSEKKDKDNRKSQGKFVSEPKHLKTWINNRCWEIEYPIYKSESQIDAEKFEEQTRRQLEYEATI
jgi:hypothetical protein